MAGWSSWSAREPHKLEVVGSNPTPASKLNKMSVEDRERHHKEKKEMVSKFRRAAAKSTILTAAGDAASMARMAVQNEIKEGALESSGAKGEAWYKAGKAIKNHEAVSILSGDGFPNS